MSHVVSAIFDTYAQATSAINDLERLGFSQHQISILTTENDKLRFSDATKAPEGAAVGGIAGGLLAGLIAGLTAVGSVMIPGVGLIAAGPIVAGFAAGAAGATAGGLVGGLIGLGIPEREAKFYEERIEEGAVLIAVEASDRERAGVVRQIFESREAQNIAA